jgi:hypothetical protein
MAYQLSSFSLLHKEVLIMQRLIMIFQIMNLKIIEGLKHL